MLFALGIRLVVVHEVSYPDILIPIYRKDKMVLNGNPFVDQNKLNELKGNYYEKANFLYLYVGTYGDVLDVNGCFCGRD